MSRSRRTERLSSRAHDSVVRGDLPHHVAHLFDRLSTPALAASEPEAQSRRPLAVAVTSPWPRPGPAAIARAAPARARRPPSARLRLRAVYGSRRRERFDRPPLEPAHKPRSCLCRTALPAGHRALLGRAQMGQHDAAQWVPQCLVSLDRVDQRVTPPAAPRIVRRTRRHIERPTPLAAAGANEERTPIEPGAYVDSRHARRRLRQPPEHVHGLPGASQTFLYNTLMTLGPLLSQEARGQHCSIVGSHRGSATQTPILEGAKWRRIRCCS